MHKAINNQLRPFGTHPYYRNARQEQNDEFRRLHGIKAIINNLKRGLICWNVAVRQLRERDCFESEIDELLACEPPVIEPCAL